jgi:hypothetical protein
MTETPTIRRYLILLLLFSAVVRMLLAASFALGNDEVYYWTYALYPSLSYFDHPPMVAWLIRLFTVNLSLNHEVFVRLAAVMAGTINILLIFSIGKKLKDELTGWYAALLYTASVYCFIIAGTFILPDSPQTVFWLAALRLMLDLLPDSQLVAGSRKKMLFTGLLLGLGMLSKYTTAFLWLAMLIYIVSRNRKWLSAWQFYAANLLILLIFSPVIAWNVSNSFISFAFHGERVAVADHVLNFNSFITELGGELLYSNPVNLIVIILALIAVFRRKFATVNRESVKVLLWSGLPLIVIFWIVSLFRNTLPHWSGPGYMTLIPIAALWIRSFSEKYFPKIILMSVLFLGLLLSLCIAQITTGFIPWPGENDEVIRKGENDISLELYGWRKLGKEFSVLSAKYELSKDIPTGAPIVSYRWFPAANLEYYAARPSNHVVMAAGPLNAIHQYAFVNRLHGGFRLNTDAWYITSSHDFRPPEALKPLYFRQVSVPDTITVMRGGKPAYFFFVYRMKDMQSKPEDPFQPPTY